jgi:tripartite-type tricarboxylate transporter receptor subunit TctC
MIRKLLLTLSSTLLVLTTVAAADDYPAKPVRLIIPFAAGGLNDVVGRLIADNLSEKLGKRFIAENRTGAGGVVGTEIAANAPKDGYTLLVVSIVNAVNTWLYKLPYDPVKAFVPVAFLATAPNVLVVNPELPVKSVKELLALAKDKPGDVPYATAGVGSFMHLSAELFKLMAGIDMLHVPFKGGGPALVDLVAGHTKVAFATTITTSPMLRSGKLRALGVGALKRSSILPELPTIDEAGVPGYDVSNWIGLMAPAGVPAAVVDTLHKEITAILQTPETQKQLAARGAEVLPMSSAEFGAFMEQEMAKWQRVVKEGKIKADH